MRHAAVPLVTSILAGFWACAPESGCAGARCGTAVIVTSAEPDVLLPVVSQSDVGVGLGDLIFAKLADVGPELNTVGDSGFVPGIARAWNFEDSVTLTFALHREAHWHDGVPVTSEDVVFTFDVYRDTLVNSPARPRLSAIASVTAEDPHTVAFRFHHVYLEQFFDAVYHMRILPRHLLDSVPRARLASHPFGRQPVGCGPYRFVRWNAAEFVELVADSAFFLGQPGLHRLIWRFAASPSGALTQLIAGEADILHAITGRESLRRASGVNHLRLVEYPLAVYAFIGFNLRDPGNTDRPHALFGNRALRRALTMAVNRDAVVRALLGDYGEVPIGPVGRPLWIWSDEVVQIPFDSLRARRMLAELGWRDGDGDGVLDRNGVPLEFELIVPSSSALRRRAAVIVQDQLKRLGVSMQIQELEFNTFMSRAAAHRFDAHFGTWAQDPSPGSIEETWTSAGITQFNFGRYANPQVDRLVRDALRAPDMATARVKWHAAISEINADAPAIWMYEPVGVAGVHERFENVSIRPDQWTTTLWTWRVPQTRLIDRDRAGPS